MYELHRNKVRQRCVSKNMIWLAILFVEGLPMFCSTFFLIVCLCIYKLPYFLTQSRPSFIILVSYELTYEMIGKFSCDANFAKLRASFLTSNVIRYLDYNKARFYTDALRSCAVLWYKSMEKQ